MIWILILIEIRFLKKQKFSRNEFTSPVMGTIFLVFVYSIFFILAIYRVCSII